MCAVYMCATHVPHWHTHVDATPMCDARDLCGHVRVPSASMLHMCAHVRVPSACVLHMSLVPTHM